MLLDNIDFSSIYINFCHRIIGFFFYIELSFLDITPLSFCTKMSTTNSDKCRRRAGFQASTDVCGSGTVSVENSQVVGLTGIFLLVSIVVSISWLIGCLSFSFVWVLILIACLFMVWKSKISRIVKHHLNVKETVLYRKRAFRHNESAEWLNFVLNRW